MRYNYSKYRQCKKQTKQTDAKKKSAILTWNVWILLDKYINVVG